MSTYFFVAPSGFAGFLILFIPLSFFAAFVAAHKPRTKTTALFFGLTMWLTVWTVARYFEGQSAPDAAPLFLRLEFIAAVFIAYFFYVFACNFPAPRRATLSERLMVVPAVMFAILAFNSLLFKNPDFSGPMADYDFGILYGLFLTYLFLAVGGGVAHLVRKLRASDPIGRAQLSYALFGLALTTATALVFSVLLSGLVPASVSRFGLYGMLFFVGFTTVAVTRHHLMNLETVATEAIVSSILIVLALETLLSLSTTEFLFRAVFFWLVAVFGLLLIRSSLEAAKRSYEAELFRHRLDELQHRFSMLERARTEFISIASHQLRTPLTVIKGYLSLAIEGVYGASTDSVAMALQRAFQQVEQTIRLIDNLLSISSLESGTVKYEKKPVKIEDLIRKVVAEYAPLAEKKMVALKFEPRKSRLPKVRVDEEKISEVIRKLIDNAIKYTDRGSITVSAAMAKKNRVAVSIKDTGLGMTPDDVAQCFQKLSRGETVKPDHPIGTGLGLFISKKYVEAHGGAIIAKSGGPGKGSEFIFTLPALT